MDNRYEKEFVERLAFLQSWFRGEVEKRDRAFARLADAFAPGFTMVSASGKVRERESVLAGFFNGYGHLLEYRFQVKDGAIRQQHGDVTICTFNLTIVDERTGTNVWTTTVVFRDEPTAPNGLLWLFLQDTPVLS